MISLNSLPHDGHTELDLLVKAAAGEQLSIRTDADAPHLVRVAFERVDEFPVASSHTLIVLSFPAPARNLPSGVRARDVIALCPRKNGRGLLANYLKPVADSFSSGPMRV